MRLCRRRRTRPLHVRLASAALSLRKMPLIGRDEETAMVIQAVDAFADLSYSSAIVFEGEAGTGKTHMLEKARECVQRREETRSLE